MVDEKTYNEMILAGAIALTQDWIGAVTGRGPLELAAVPMIVRTMFTALYDASRAGGTEAPKAEGPLVSAVLIKESVTPDYIICLDDGMRCKSMKRHLAKLGMTPDQYRTKWGLPYDYPMVAPNYSAKRSQLAKDNGLGRK